MILYYLVRITVISLQELQFYGVVNHLKLLCYFCTHILIHSVDICT